MKSKARSFVTVGLLFLASCSQREAMIGFPMIGPVDDADPAVRESRSIELPTRLVVKREEERLSYTVDADSLEAVRVSVGRKMVTGLMYELTIRRNDGSVAVSGRRGMTTSSNIGEGIINRSQDGIPVDGESYVVELRFDVFETDIPAQHRWSPRSGKFRVVMTRTLKADSSG